MTSPTQTPTQPAAAKTQPVVHTPAPWRVGGNLKGFFDVRTDTTAPPIVNWMGFDDSWRLREEHLANARLIAAAPELLAACRRAEQLAASLERELGDWDAVDAGHLAAIREAIDKATGLVV